MTRPDIYAQHPADYSKPFSGVMETLDALNARGIPMVVRLKAFTDLLRLLDD